MNGAAAFVAALERNGVDTVFGIPGVHNLEIYRYLAGSSVCSVAVRHEQGGGYAADGYARASGRPGVCLTTSGPGATNACTAAATAYADSVPVLFCSPGPPVGLERLDLGLLHEMKDQSAHFESLVAASVRPTSSEEIGEVVDEVFAGWRRSRQRPVYLELPIDVIEAPPRFHVARDEVAAATRVAGADGAEAGNPRSPGGRRLRDLFDSTGPGAAATRAASDADDALDRAAALLSGARRPVLVLGGGARTAGSGARQLAERIGALVATTVNGKGALPETHPASLGASIRLAGARRLIESADVVVVAGSELAESDLWAGPLRPSGSVIRIDIDPHQLHKNLVATVAVRMDAAAALRALSERLAESVSDTQPEPSAADRAEEIRAALRQEALVEGAPYEAINEKLSAALPKDTVVAGDSAQVSYFGTAHFWPMHRVGQFLYPTGYATLGYGLPAAIGAKLACPDLPVVALVGDGGFLFTAQELLTAVEQRLPVPVVVADNHGYAEIRQGMERRGIPPVNVDRPDVDFAGLCRAFGGQGHAVECVDDLCDRVVEALTADGPTVISIDVSEGCPR